MLKFIFINANKLGNIKHIVNVYEHFRQMC